MTEFKRDPDDCDPWSHGYNCCYDKLMPEIERLRVLNEQLTDCIRETILNIDGVVNEATATKRRASEHYQAVISTDPKGETPPTPGETE